MARDPAEFEGIPLEQVLDVLRRHDVDVLEKDGVTYLSKGDVHKAFEFPPRVHRRMLHRLSHIFDIPVHLLFRPEMLLN